MNQYRGWLLLLGAVAPQGSPPRTLTYEYLHYRVREMPSAASVTLNSAVDWKSEERLGPKGALVMQQKQISQQCSGLRSLEKDTDSVFSRCAMGIISSLLKSALNIYFCKDQSVQI